MIGEPALWTAGAIHAAASAFVAARRDHQALSVFPGALPDDLETAYAIQSRELALWPDGIAGWKVGRLSMDLIARYGVDRFIGPIFAKSVTPVATVGPTPFAMIAGGFAGFEAELVLTLGEDADPARLDWTADDAAMLVGGMHIGIEVAGSSLGTINALGSLANIAGFGNNMGLIIGAKVSDWRSRPEESLSCRTTIDGTLTGQGRAADLPGGIMTGLAYALGRAVRLGYPMKAGTLVSTGALTGVHSVARGQICSASFGELGGIDCLVVPIE